MAAAVMSYQKVVVVGGISGRGMELPVLKQLGKPSLEVPLRSIFNVQSQNQVIIRCSCKVVCKFPCCNFYLLKSFRKDALFTCFSNHHFSLYGYVHNLPLNKLADTQNQASVFYELK